MKSLQKDYRKLFDEVKKHQEPLFVCNNAQPEMVIMSLEMYETFRKTIQEAEEQKLQEAIHVYKKEKKAGTLRKLHSLSDLVQ